MNFNSFGIAALVWAVLKSGIAAPVAESRIYPDPWHAPEERQPLQALFLYPDDGSTGRSLNGVATRNNSSSACAYYVADTSSYCDIGAEDLCNLDDEMGEHFRRACQTTCQICKVGAPVIDSNGLMLLIIIIVVPSRMLSIITCDCMELNIFRLMADPPAVLDSTHRVSMGYLMASVCMCPLG